jgi:hypothetical protein
LSGVVAVDVHHGVAVDALELDEDPLAVVFLRHGEALAVFEYTAEEVRAGGALAGGFAAALLADQGIMRDGHLRLTIPPLTTMGYDTALVTAATVQAILARLDKEESSDQRTEVHPTLIERETT